MSQLALKNERFMLTLRVLLTTFISFLQKIDFILQLLQGICLDCIIDFVLALHNNPSLACIVFDAKAIVRTLLIGPCFTIRNLVGKERILPGIGWGGLCWII